VTKTPKYLAVDPGDTTGYARFNDLGDIISFGQIKESDFNDWLRDELGDNKYLRVICEDYRNHAWTRQTNWSRNKTSKKIGGLEAICNFFKIELVLQPNTVKAIGYMWGGIEVPTNHSISHQFDAYAHGVYHLQQEGIRKPGQGLNL
jgi:hypothetical protein